MGSWAGRAAWLATALAGAGAGWFLAGRQLDRRVDLERLTLLVDTGRFGEAERLLALRLADQPFDNAGWMLEGRRRAAADDLAGAVEAFGRVEETSNTYYPEAQLRRGQAALLRDDAAAAEASLTAALRRCEPGSPPWKEAARQLLDILETQDRGPQYQQVIEALIQRSNLEERPLLRDRATIHESARVPVGDRLVQLRKYVAANPADAVSLGALALALGEDGQAEAAFQMLAPTMAAPGAHPYELHRAWAQILYDLQKFDELRAALAAAPAETQAHPWHWRYLSTAQQRANDWPAALESIRKAVALDPRNPGLHREYAAVAHRAGRPELGAAAEKKSGVLKAEETELRDAWKKWIDLNQRRASFAETAAAATRLAAACMVAEKPGGAAYYREMAAVFNEQARLEAAAKRP